jgi:hypothetical protein
VVFSTTSPAVEVSRRAAAEANIFPDGKALLALSAKKGITPDWPGFHCFSTGEEVSAVCFPGSDEEVGVAGPTAVEAPVLSVFELVVPNGE